MNVDCNTYYLYVFFPGAFRALPRYGGSGLRIGHRGLVTYMALKAMEMPDPAHDAIVLTDLFGLKNPLFAV